MSARRALLSSAASAKGTSIPSPSPACWWLAMPRLPGAKTPAEAVEHADVLEYIARLAFRSVLLGSPEAGIPKYVSEYHHLRKHGPKATYGQH